MPRSSPLQVRDCLQVEWTDPSAPDQGWAYLYLTDEDHKRLVRDPAARGAAVPTVRAEVRPQQGASSLMLSLLTCGPAGSRRLVAGCAH